jgi:hypothetical protein
VRLLRAPAAAAILGLGIIAAAGHETARADGVSGATLLDRVHAAYPHVPAVVVTVTGQSAVDGVFTEILRSGLVVAEQFVGSNASGTTMLVAPNGTPTYAREPRTACWRTLAKSDGQTLSDVGQQFLGFLTATNGLSLSAPHRTATGWTLAFGASGTSGTVTIGKTMLVGSITLTHGAMHARENVDNLLRPPTLASPRPLC